MHKWTNEGKHIHLITRNKKYDSFCGSIQMFGLKLAITVVPLDKNKSDYINPHGAIFIDDSFAEREEVAHHLGIRVFDLSALPMFW
jgi:hypothetical protein